MEKLLILGAGGYGRTVAEAAAGQFETAFLDDASPLAAAPCERYAEFAGEYAFAYPAFGDNALRAQWLQRLKAAGFRLPVLRHAQSFVSPSAVVKAGNRVPPQEKIDSGCVLARAAMPGKGNGLHV